MRKFKRLFYIILFLVVLEFILQLVGFFLTWNLKKQHVKANTDFIILCIGDSFTYGLGAPSDESYPKQLQHILNKAAPERHIKVINLGIPGYSSSQCLRYLKQEVDSYEPKIVLIMAGLNNCWNFMDSSYFRIKQFRYSNPLDFRMKSIDALLCRLKTYKLIKIFFLNLTARMKSKEPLYKENPLPEMKFQIPLRSDELTKLLNQGLRYFEEGKYDLSEALYRKALELAPHDFESHWFMGRFYILKGQREKAKEELILAAKYAPHPYTITCILADLQDRHQPRNSKEFQEFASLIKKLRSYWVEKFGEEYIHRIIDPVISYEENDLVKVLAYDFEEMANYLRQKKLKLVVLTYPFPATRFRFPENIYYRLSRYLDLPLVDNASAFNKYINIYRYEELFSADGHCTSKGYGLIAENVSGVLKKYNLLPFD